MSYELIIINEGGKATVRYKGKDGDPSFRTMNLKGSDTVSIVEEVVEYLRTTYENE